MHHWSEMPLHRGHILFVVQLCPRGWNVCAMGSARISVFHYTWSTLHRKAARRKIGPLDCGTALTMMYFPECDKNYRTLFLVKCNPLYDRYFLKDKM